MKLNEHDMEIVDAYLLGELKGDALIDFEQRLKEDTAFAEDVEEMRVLMLAAKRSTLEEKMKFLQEEEIKFEDVVVDSKNPESKTIDTNSEQAKVKRLPWKKILSVAASVLVIGVLGVWWSGQNAEEVPTLVDTSNFPDAPVELFMSNEKTEYSPKMIKASNIYNLAIHEEDAKTQHEYFRKASVLFGEVWEEERDSVALGFFKLIDKTIK